MQECFQLPGLQRTKLIYMMSKISFNWQNVSTLMTLNTIFQINNQGSYHYTEKIVPKPVIPHSSLMQPVNVQWCAPARCDALGTDTRAGARVPQA